MCAAQVEGGFVFGLGMMLQEHVDYSKEGQPLYDSTWDYKIPTAACIPRQFNIALLKVARSFACPGHRLRFIYHHDIRHACYRLTSVSMSVCNLAEAHALL